MPCCNLQDSQSFSSIFCSLEHILKESYKMKKENNAFTGWLFAVPTLIQKPYRTYKEPGTYYILGFISVICAAAIGTILANPAWAAPAMKLLEGVVTIRLLAIVVLGITALFFAVSASHESNFSRLWYINKYPKQRYKKHCDKLPNKIRISSERGYRQDGLQHLVILYVNSQNFSDFKNFCKRHVPVAKKGFEAVDKREMGIGIGLHPIKVQQWLESLGYIFDNGEFPTPEGLFNEPKDILMRKIDLPKSICFFPRSSNAVKVLYDKNHQITDLKVLMEQLGGKELEIKDANKDRHFHLPKKFSDVLLELYNLGYEIEVYHDGYVAKLEEK